MNKAFQRLKGLANARPGPSSEPTPDNVTLFEAFEWYARGDLQHWRRLRAALSSLKSIGVDLIWLPPGCKASHQGSNGYDTYDLYDLGEFDQKGHVSTKWGSKEDLVALCAAAKAQGLGLLWDAVLNHKAAADYTQVVNAVEVDPSDRRKALNPPKEIEAWLGWDFEGRAGRNSAMKYNASHFNATDFDSRTSKPGIYKLLGHGEKDWAKDVDLENGNFDFLLLNNYDLSREDVRDDFQRWAEWIGSELSLAGIRFDAAKHMSREFMKDHVRRLDSGIGRKWFLVAEYCTSNLQTLVKYIDEMEGRVHLFDFPLHGNLVAASHAKSPDLRLLLNGTLLERRPRNTVAHVANHDSQERGQDFETTVADHFIPMAYALILFHEASMYPCIFFGDLYGVQGPERAQPATCYGKLPRMALARKLFAYGRQRDYFDQAHCIGFTRGGEAGHAQGAGLAVVMNVGAEPASKRMKVGQQHSGERWTDLLELYQGEVQIDDKGYGVFPVGSKMVGVWVNGSAQGKHELDALPL